MESQCRSLGYRDAFAAGEECSNLDIYDNLCFSCPWVFAIIAYGEALTLILSSLRNPVRCHQSVLFLGCHFTGG